MGSKLFSPQHKVIDMEIDFSLTPKAAGDHIIGKLPDNFVVESVDAHTVSAINATSITIGNASDADGYATDIIAAQAADKVVRGKGVLVFNNTDKTPIIHKIIPANDGVTLTVVGNATAGKLIVYVKGYQAQ